MSGIRDILEGLRKENRLRMIPSTPAQGTLDLSSNDYLSLGSHGAEWREEFFDLYPHALFSSSASRLLSAQQTYHTMLEDQLEGPLFSWPTNSSMHRWSTDCEWPGANSDGFPTTTLTNCSVSSRRKQGHTNELSCLWSRSIAWTATKHPYAVLSRLKACFRG